MRILGADSRGPFLVKRVIYSPFNADAHCSTLRISSCVCIDSFVPAAGRGEGGKPGHVFLKGGEESNGDTDVKMVSVILPQKYLLATQHRQGGVPLLLSSSRLFL